MKVWVVMWWMSLWMVRVVDEREEDTQCPQCSGSGDVSKLPQERISGLDISEILDNSINDRRQYFRAPVHQLTLQRARIHRPLVRNTLTTCRRIFRKRAI